MKTRQTFSESELCHVWANKGQESGRKQGNGNIFFEGDIIYSYGHHFPIAAHVNNKKGEKAILFTLATYSNTTSGHIGSVRMAASHLHKIYVPYVPDYIRNLNDKKCSEHIRLFTRWVSEIEAIAPKLIKARKPAIYLDEIDGIKAQVNEYCRFFGIKVLPKELKQAMGLTDAEQYKQFAADKVKRQERLRKAEAKKKMKDFAERLAAFRLFAPLTDGGHIINEVYNYLDGNRAYLRFNKESQRVETSKGIEIPVKIAKGFYFWLKGVIKTGGCNGCEKKILDYEVKAVSPKEFTVNCHTIAMSEAEAIAKELNW